MKTLPPAPESNSDSGRGLGRRSTEENTPRWVYVFGTVAIVLVLLFVILHLAGGGLGGHTPR